MLPKKRDIHTNWVTTSLLELLIAAKKDPPGKVNKNWFLIQVVVGVKLWFWQKLWKMLTNYPLKLRLAHHVWFLQDVLVWLNTGHILHKWVDHSCWHIECIPPCKADAEESAPCANWANKTSKIVLSKQTPVLQQKGSEICILWALGTVYSRLGYILGRLASRMYSV